MQLTASQIIEQHGGSAAFAKACGLEPAAVRMMKHRNKLPRSVWPEIMKAIPEISLDTLLAAESSAQTEAV